MPKWERIPEIINPKAKLRNKLNLINNKNKDPIKGTINNDTSIIRF